MVDQALQAIRSDDVGAYVALVEDSAVAVAHRLSKPDGSPWTPEDVEDLVSSFYMSAAYEHVVLNAHDDDSLRALVFTGLANLARVDLRRTEPKSARSSLRRMSSRPIGTELSETDSFVDRLHLEAS